tara:strand:+ start:16 stop:624 length:609 start_codon:yes stop_codon:yes gene_type:complete
MPLNTTSKLEAVNTMLGSIGEAPVNSLTSGLVDAETAEKILDSVSREVQARGWSFNTDINLLYTPDASNANQISLTSSVLRIEMAEAKTEHLDVVQRGLKLYNRAKASFYFDPSVTGVKMNVVTLLEFGDLPEAAKRYITLRAARIFQDRVVSSSELHGFQQRDELMALVELEDADGQVSDHNIFDNYSVASGIDRMGGTVI